jgi:hypothetical protein
LWYNEPDTGFDNLPPMIAPAHVARGGSAMGIFDKLRKALSSPGTASSSGYNYWFYVRCAQCGETLEGRVDMRNELSRRDDSDGFFVRKRLMGSKRCFNSIDVTLYFDAGRKLSGQEIHGGEFTTAEEHGTGISTE